MNAISKWLNRLTTRRQQKRRLAQLSSLAHTFNTYDRLEQSGLLHFDIKQRRLFIEQPVAHLMMTNADTWSNFLKGVHLWQYDRELHRLWEEYLQREELAAVHSAMEKNPALTRADIDRIKRARRASVVQNDVQPPAVQPFEYFIIREEYVPGNDSPLPSAAIFAVGHYDPTTGLTEIATWNEVKTFLK